MVISFYHDHPWRIVRTEDNCVPPVRDLGVSRHETSVNIWLLVHGLARLSPDLLTVVKESVRDRSFRDDKQDAVYVVREYLQVMDANERP